MKTLKAFFAATTLMLVSLQGFAAQSLPTITVFKSPTCGCCTGWVKHLEENGFKVKSFNVDDVTVYKKEADLPYGMGSCHTAFVGDYAVEGHVPAADIKRMLSEKPAIRGLTVPGMPMGSPGMDFGPQKDAYKTYSYTKDGQTQVFASH
ncbi:DUF411 domain-containing protein [Endozoicomonadaceae bacterium StTr2]